MTEYFDFRDGNGDVPAHRHPNGGGWVADTAYVTQSAYVGPDARVYHNAVVFDDVKISGYAQVFGNARVCRGVIISGYSKISGFARVSGEVIISGYARVSGIERSDGYAFIYVPDYYGVMKVQAGCRNFTMEEAKDHWEKTRGGTLLGDETMAILQALEILSKVRPEGCV